MRPRRRLSRADILPVAEYAARRREQRRRITELKRHRRVEVGPFATFYFENWDTMWHQVHEMLYIEKGGEEQIEADLLAYNPLIPQGRELVATVMFEIDEPLRRNWALRRLGGIEHRAFIEIGGTPIAGEPDPGRQSTNPDGKISAVQFLRFPLDDSQIARFRTPGVQILLGFDHPNYGHIAVIPEPVRATLAQDFD